VFAYVAVYPAPAAPDGDPARGRPREETAAVWRSIRLSGAPSATMARLSPPSRT